MMAFQSAQSKMSLYVQQLRRQVIAETVRFPEFGLMYWENGFLRVINSVARCLSVLYERNPLAAAGPTLAAHHYAGIRLWIPSNQTMFAIALPLDKEAHAATINSGSKVLPRAYRPKRK